MTSDFLTNLQVKMVSNKKKKMGGLERARLKRNFDIQERAKNVENYIFLLKKEQKNGL